jgi:hypothetical protein
LAAGVSLTLYFGIRFAKRPSVLTSTFGVTVFNWKTVTLPWASITDVVLTPATRLRRRGWVPGIVQRGGQVLPVAFAAFLPSGPQAQGAAPDMPVAGGVSEVPALIRRGLDAHNRVAAQPAGTVPAAVANWADVGRSPLELPPTDGRPWASDRLAISREWVAFKEVTGKVPWNVIPYATVSSVRVTAGGGMAISRPDGLGVVIDKTVLASLAACDFLAAGLRANPAVALAAGELLQPYLETARRERDSSLAGMRAVDRSGTTHTFGFQRRLNLVYGIVAVAGGAACLATIVAAPFTAGHLGFRAPGNRCRAGVS